MGFILTTSVEGTDGNDCTSLSMCYYRYVYKWCVSQLLPKTHL